MASISVAGDTSGSITIAAPNVAGTNTLTLPANTGTVITTASTFAGTGPAFSAYATSTQSCTGSAQTKIILAGKNFDTNNNYSTANSRFTPTVAGYYSVTGIVALVNNVANVGTYVHIYKNGAGVASASSSANTATYGNACVTALIYMNGSTDYLELYATSSGSTYTTTNNVVGSNDGVIFSGFLARSA